MLFSKRFGFIVIAMALFSCAPSNDKAPKASGVIKDNSPVPADESQMSVEESTQSLACIKSICGEETPFKHPFEKETGADLKQKSLAQFKLQMQRPIQIFMGHTIHKNLIIDSALKKVNENSDAIHLSARQRSFYQLLNFFNRLAKMNGSAIKPQADGTYAYDEEKLSGLLTKEQKPFISLFRDTNQLLWQSQMVNYMYYRSEIDAIMAMFYPGLSVMDALAKEGLLIQTVAESVKDVFPLLVLRTTNNAVLSKVIEKKPITRSEAHYFKNLSQMAHTLSLYYAYQNFSAFADIPLDEKNEFAQQFASYQESEVGRAFKTKSTIKQTLQTAVAQCSERVANSYGALPSSQQIQKFQQLLSVIIQTSKSMIEEKLNQSVPEKFKYEVLYPTARESAVSEWSEDLMQMVQETDLVLSGLKKIDQAAAGVPESLLMNLVMKRADLLFEETISFCDKTQPGFLIDAAYIGQNKIVLSWPTITNPQLGIGIIAHEVGHMVSFDYKEVVEKTKSCLTKKYGTDQYAEEDFADLFSSEVLNRLSYQVEDVKTTNMACGLLPTDQSGFKADSLKNSRIGDTHSSGVYRLIAVANVTNTLTRSCSSFAKNYGYARNFENYCSW